MRDIREDLKERVSVIELHINGVHGVFEQQVEQLKKARDSKLAELRTELDAVNRVMQLEQRRLGSPPTQHQQAATLTEAVRTRRAM